MNTRNFDKYRQIERENTLVAQRGEARTVAQAALDVLHIYRNATDYGTQYIPISVSAGLLEEFFEAVDSMECPLKEPEPKTEEFPMKQEHRKEPWYAEDAKVLAGDKADPALVCHCNITTSHWKPYLKETKANAHRIVACVNACAGIPTLLLEHKIAALRVLKSDVAAGRYDEYLEILENEGKDKTEEKP